MSGSNVSVISSFLFTPTRRQFWPNVAGTNMRPIMPNMQILATVADVCGVSRSRQTEPFMDDKRENVDPTKLSVSQLSKLLSNAYRQRVPEEQIRADIEAGAPTNVDGTINLVVYTAWLLQEMHRGD